MQDNNEIELLKSQIRSMTDEFLQYKKRVKENEEKYRGKTKKEFIKNLLGTLDALDRTIKDIYGEEETVGSCELINKISKGRGSNLEMIYGELLDSQGITSITPERGEAFDDVKHTALEVINDADYPENTVVSVVRNGYLFSGEIIRPAEVVISKGGGKGVFKKKEKEMRGGIFSNIRGFITGFIESKLLKEKSGELKSREEKIIKKEIELKREAEESADKINSAREKENELAEKENELAEKENDVLKREGKIGEYAEKTMLELMEDLSVRKRELAEMEQDIIAAEENINAQLGELETRESKLDELLHQLNVREENVSIMENETRDKTSQLAQLNSCILELSLNKTKLEEECSKLKEYAENYGVKEKEYDELNKNLISKTAEFKELEKKEDTLKNRVTALEKKRMDLIIENMKLKTNFEL